MPKKKSARKNSRNTERKGLGLNPARLLVFGVILGGGLFLAWRLFHPADGHSPTKPETVKPLVEPEAQAYAGYAGSASCKNCHEEAYSLWQTSNHGHAERLPEADLDKAAFDPARTFHHGTQTSSIRLDGVQAQESKARAVANS